MATLTTNILAIKDLAVSVGNKRIFEGFNLTIKSREIHAIMGPNGSGKSTLLNSLMGHPKYAVESGKILFNRQDITRLSPTDRSLLGMYLAFQNPIEIPGVTFGNFLRTAKNVHIKAENGGAILGPKEFAEIMKIELYKLGMETKFIGRCLNEGFSGGEKKRAEIVQMALLEPKFALIDEVDSGLDVDALKIVAHAILKIVEKTNAGVLLVTHYQRLLHYIIPHYVHIMMGGRIVRSGGKEIAEEVEERGYKV